MVHYEDSMGHHNGGLVVSTGGYSGGGFVDDPLGWALSTVVMHPGKILAFIVVLLILLVVMLMSNGAGKSDFTSGFNPQFAQSGSARGEGHSDGLRSSGFMGSRDEPYFSDVTNRVLRMENREKDAVRALGKINQERLRRASEDTMGTNPLPWGPFWKEWQETHVMDGEDVKESFSYSDSM